MASFTTEPAEDDLSLPFTPTWAVASVTATFVLISLLVERCIHYLTWWFSKRGRKPLYQSLEKMKEELMLLGFISLFMSALASIFLGICVDESFYNRQFATCKHITIPKGRIHERKVFEFLNKYVIDGSSRTEQMCPEGKEPFISLQDIHEIHGLLFLTAVTHILYSCMTVALALVKVCSWTRWEQEAHGETYDSFDEIAKDIPLNRQFVFALHHTSKPWTFNRFLVWVACFIRQFGKSVTRADYLAIRSGFIAAHNLDQEYNFHTYILRCVEDDFTRIVGISAPLWGFAVICILLNSDGFNLYFYVAFIPMIVALAIGTKLQHVIATLTVEKLGVKRNSGDTKKSKSYNELFWFGCPEFILWLLHFILFQNAFELATFFWSLWHFPDHSCVLKNHFLLFIRLGFGLIVQVLCSYSTLPMYGLVTQIGWSFKKTMLSKRVQESLHKWHMDTRERLRCPSYLQQVGSMTNLNACEGGQQEENDESLSKGQGGI